MHEESSPFVRYLRRGASLALLALAVLTGCHPADFLGMTGHSGGSSDQVSTVSLPAPSALLARSASGIALYRVDASAWDPQLQPQHAQNGNLVMDFTPAYAADAAAPTGLAYALYRLNATAFDGDPSLRLGWSIPPASGTAWVALADVTADRWDWRSVPASGKVILPEGLTPHASASGDVLALVALTGVDNNSELLYIRLGNEPPSPAVIPTPQSGSLPLDVTFDASLSRDLDGAIVRYDFDYGDGGGFVEEPGPVGHHTYTLAGLYTATLFITDDEGGWSQLQVQVNAGEVANHAPTAFDQFQSAIMLTSINFGLTASDPDPGTQLSYEIVAWPAHGTLDASNLPNVHYLPTSTGQDSFTFRVFDGLEYSNTATVSISVSPGDGP